MGKIHLFIGKLHFFSKIYVFSNLLGPKKRSYYFYISCQNIFLAFMNRFLRFVKIDNARFCWANIFFHWKDCLFSKKNVFETTSVVPKKKSHNFHHKRQDTLWSLTKEYPISGIVGNRREEGQNFFFREDSFNFEKFKFLVLDFLRLKKWSYSLHHTRWKTLCTLIYCSLTFFVFDNAGKKWGSFFIPWLECLFSKICVFNNLLRPKEWSYYYHSNCQIIFLAPIKRFLRFDTLDNLRKHKANTFVHWKTAFFPKVVFSATS